MERHDKRLTEHFCLDEFTYSGIAVDNAVGPGNELGFYSHSTEDYRNCNLECDMI